jgi:hypothetical protein
MAGQTLRGTLAFKQVKSGSSAATRATKTLPMPGPWHSSTIIRAAVVNSDLGNGKPVFRQVRQGSLPNCPIAGILSALGNTDVGQKYLDSLITEYRGTTVKTTLSGDVLSKLTWPDEDPDDKPQAKELTSKRYFVLSIKNLKTEAREVHDTFYVKYTDGTDYELAYMNSPANVLWPSVIEKACALHFGSYPAMADWRKNTANDYWKLVVGSDPGGFSVEDSTDLGKIRDAAREAARTPTIAASREHLPSGSPVHQWHAHALLGATDKTVELYDPMEAKTVSLSTEDFRKLFQVILFGKP